MASASSPKGFDRRSVLSLPEPWRAAYLFDVVVGFERRWTFYKWIVEPGTLRKHNSAHGSCGVCDHEENPARDLPSLEWEIENLALKRDLARMTYGE